MDEKLSIPDAAAEKETDVLTTTKEPQRAKEHVRKKYQENLEAQKSNPDRIIYAGDDLIDLDSSLFS
jgi:hypothetical protein